MGSPRTVGLGPASTVGFAAMGVPRKVGVGPIAMGLVSVGVPRNGARLGMRVGAEVGWLVQRRQQTGTWPRPMKTLQRRHVQYGGRRRATCLLLPTCQTAKVHRRNQEKRIESIVGCWVFVTAFAATFLLPPMIRVGISYSPLIYIYLFRVK